MSVVTHLCPFMSCCLHLLTLPPSPPACARSAATPAGKPASLCSAVHYRNLKTASVSHNAMQLTPSLSLRYLGGGGWDILIG